MKQLKHHRPKAQAGAAVVMALFMWLTDKTLEWLFYDIVLGWR